MLSYINNGTMVPKILTFISWYHGTIYMQKHPIVEKKLADWVSAFNSIPKKQTQEAQILKSLILGLRSKLNSMEDLKIASC